jgi:hypothetical protein
MADAETTRYAGWVWQTLTGVDLQTNGLTLPEPEFDPLITSSEARRDADNGLSLPNTKAIVMYKPQLPTGIRILLGQEITPAHALSMLEEQRQAVRVIAAHALSMIYPAWAPQIRASMPEQAVQISTLREALVL